MKRKSKLCIENTSPKRVNSSSRRHPQTTKHNPSFKFKPPKGSVRSKASLKKSIRSSPVPTLPISNAGISDSTSNNQKSTKRIRHKRTCSDMIHTKHTSHLNLSLKPTEALLKKNLEDRPISPDRALRKYAKYLTKYEHTEILNYKEIYFFGKKAKKMKTPGEFNYGFDDDRGEYQVVLGDHIGYRYEIIATLGSGSFGKVVKVYDHKRKRHAAVKVIRNKGRFHQQAAVEIKILKFLKNKKLDCVIHLQDYFPFRNHVCIVFELLSLSLFDLMRKNDFQGLSYKLIKRLGIQLLHALKAQETFKIIHCDLKPENIMLKSSNRSALNVIDYGSSCFENEKLYTYIQSRFYRAPEIILGVEYSTKIDMWSFGCILAELFTGIPLFPGESEHEQLVCIMEVLGLPPESLMRRATRSHLFFDNGRPILYTNKRGKTRLPCTKRITEVLNGAESTFIHLVTACLEWDPEVRISPQEAINHQWFTKKVHKRGYSMQPQLKTTKSKHSHKPSLC